MQQIIGTTVNQVNTAAVIDRKIISVCVSGMHPPVLDRSIPTIRWKQVMMQLMSAN